MRVCLLFWLLCWLGGPGAAQPTTSDQALREQRWSEVLVDLQRVPELDDRLVGLAVLQVLLGPVERLLLLDLGRLAAGAQRQDREQDHQRRGDAENRQTDGVHHALHLSA